MRRKVIISLSVFLIGGLVLLALFLRFGQFNEKLRAMAVEQASVALKHPVGIDRLVINLFPAYVDIKGFLIKDAGGGILFSAREVRGYLSWSDILLHKKIDLRQVTVDDPVLTVSRPEGGEFSITTLVKEIHRLIVEPPDIPYKVDIREVRLRNGTVNLDDAVARVRVIASQVGGNLLNRKDAWQASVSTDKGRLTLVEGREMPFAVDGRVKASAGKTELESLTISLRKSRVTLAGLVGEADGIATFDGDASLEAGLDELRDLVPALEGLGGKLAVKARVKGPLDNPEASGNLKGEIVAGKPLLETALPISDIRAEFKGSRQGLKLSGLTATAVDGRVKGDISLTRGEGGGWSYQLAGNLEQGSLKKLQDFFVGRDLVKGGTVNVRAEASGNHADGVVRGRAEFSAAPVMAPATGVQGVLTSGIREAGGVVTFGPDGFVLEQGQVTSSLYSVAARGSVGKDRSLKLSVSCRVPEILPILKEAGYDKLKGEGRAEGTLTGTFDSPVFSGRTMVTNALWNGVGIASADGEIVLSKEKLTSSRILLIQGKGSYVFNGEVRFGKEIFYDARVRIKDGDPRQVTRIFYKDLPMTMAASGELSFRGTSKEFSGDGFLEAPKGSAYGQDFDNLAVQAKLFTDRIRFPSITARRGSAKSAASGEISWKGDYIVDLKAEGVDTAALGFFDKDVPVKALAKLRVRGQGNVDHPRLEVEAETPGIRYRTIATGKGRLKGVLDDGHFEGDASFPELGMQADAKAELTGKRVWSVDARLKDSKLSMLPEFFSPKLAGVALSATGRVAFAGEGGDWEALRGTVDLTSVKTEVEGYPLVNDGPLGLIIQGDAVTVRRLAFKGKGTSLDALGSLRVGESYNLLVRGEAEVSLLKTFSRKLEGASGRSDLVLSIEGHWDDPDTTGILHVAGGQFKVKDVKYRITDLDAVFMFGRDEVILQSLRGMASGGSFSGTGQVILKKFRPDSIFLALTIDNFRYRHEDALTAILDGRLNYEKTQKGQLISGEVMIDHARYTKRVDWKTALLKTRDKGGIPVLDFDIPVIGTAALNVHCFGEEKFVIDNNLARLPISVDLYLRGTVNRPRILGRLEAAKGNVYLRSTDYTIASAVVEFSDPDRIYPSFNITANTAVRDYKVTMNLAGTLDRFSVNLQSDPPLQDIDVIGLLTVGKTGAEIGEGEGGMAAGEAVSFVTGQVQDVMEERVKQITGFDRFQLDPYAGGIQSSGGARLTVGKRLLNERLLVTYTANIGSTEEQVLTVEYKLAKNISLVGKKDEKGRVKADLKYRFEFR